MEQSFFVFDVDDTIANLREPLHRALTNETGITIGLESWNVYDIFRYYGMDRADFLDIIHKHDLLKKCKPEPGAYECIEHIRESGHKIGLLTARGWNPDALKITHAWLEEHGIQVDRLHIMSSGVKGDYIHQFDNAVMFVDDHHAHVDSVHKMGVDSWIVERPWNSEHKIQNRVDNLHVLLNVLKNDDHPVMLL